MIQPLGCRAQTMIDPALEFIRQDSVAPGLALIILIIGLLAGLQIVYIGWRDSSLLNKARDIFPNSEADFSASYPFFEEKMRDLPLMFRAWTEFCETLVVPKRDQSQPVFKNTIRPHEFFNLRHLHIGLSDKKHWPNLAVGIGLFLTFLGLISALGEALTAINVKDVDSDQIQESLSGLLGATSAKFYASMSALFVSLILTIALRINEVKIEKALDQLNDKIERGVQFVTQEGIAQDTVNLMEQQLEQLQSFNTHLAIDIGNAVKNSLEQAFQPIVDNMNGLTANVGEGTTLALTQAADMMVEKIQGATLDSLNNIAETLTNLDGSLSHLTLQLTETLDGFKTGFDSILANMRNEVTGTTSLITSDISEVLRALEGSLTQTTASITNVMTDVAATLSAFKTVSRESTEQISNEFEESTAQTSEKLNKVLSELADTMATFSNLSEEMSNRVVQNFGDSINEAAGSASGALTDAGKSIARAVKDATDEATNRTLDSGNAAGAVIAGAGEKFEKQLSEILIHVGDITATTAGDAGAQIKNAGDSIAQGFEASTKTLVNALDSASSQFVLLEKKLDSLPLRLENIKTALDASSATILRSNKGLESTNNELSDKVQIFVQGINTLQTTMSQASNTLTGAGTSITSASERITQTTTTLASQLEKQVTRADQTDANIAKYLNDINRTTNQVLTNLGSFATDLDNNIGNAIGQLNSVVDELVGSVEMLQEDLRPEDGK